MIKAILLAIYILGCIGAFGCALHDLWKGEDDFTGIFCGFILSLAASLLSWVTVMCAIIAIVKQNKKMKDYERRNI